MSLINLFNDNFFSDFDRMFDDAFDRRTRGGAGEVQRPSDNNAPRVLRPRYVLLPLIRQEDSR